MPPVPVLIRVAKGHGRPTVQSLTERIENIKRMHPGHARQTSPPEKPTRKRSRSFTTLSSSTTPRTPIGKPRRMKSTTSTVPIPSRRSVGRLSPSGKDDSEPQQFLQKYSSSESSQTQTQNQTQTPSQSTMERQQFVDLTAAAAMPSFEHCLDVYPLLATPSPTKEQEPRPSFVYPAWPFVYSARPSFAYPSTGLLASFQPPVQEPTTLLPSPIPNHMWDQELTESPYPLLSTFENGSTYPSLAPEDNIFYSLCKSKCDDLSM